jgi:ABC-type multidrug transport system fused ATPase/permease subunit
MIFEKKTQEQILHLIPKKFRLKIILINFLNLFGSAIEILSIGMLPLIIYGILYPEKTQLFFHNKNIFFFDFFFLNKNFEINLALILLFIFFFKNLILLFLQYTQKNFFLKLTNFMKIETYKGYLQIPHVVHLEKHTSKMSSLINVQIPETVMVIESFLILIREIIVSALFFFLLCFVNLKITLFVSASLIFLLILYYQFFYKKINELGKSHLENKLNSYKSINDSFDLIKEIKIYGIGHYFINIFSKMSKYQEKQKLNNLIISIVPQYFIELFFISIISMLIFFYKFNGKELLDLMPIILIFTTVFLRLLPSFKTINSCLNIINFNSSNIEYIYNEINELKSNNPKLNQNSDIDSKNKIFFSKNIKFKNVNYYFKTYDIKVLENISFEILRGEKIGIVGESGSGKTTLLNNILGFLKPKSGRILVDDIELDSQNECWKFFFGYVPQEISIFDDTIENNIVCGRQDLDKDFNNQLKLKNALLKTNLYDFVNNLKEKEKTLIGNKGAKISGGERQRIGIARAIYNNPKILILDEATNSLDENNEEKIINNIFEDKNLTCFYINHNYKILHKCDKILHLKSGKVIFFDNPHSFFSNLNLYKNN